MQTHYRTLALMKNAVLFKNSITAPQWTVVMFWASDCHVCNVEAQQFVKLHRDYKSKNIRVLGVSVDGNDKKSQAQEFIDNHNINFPNLIGEPGNIADLYKAYTNETWLGTPSIMVFSPEGKIMAHRIGMLPTDLIIKFIEGQSN
jgi:peroxiredoxin